MRFLIKPLRAAVLSCILLTLISMFFVSCRRKRVRQYEPPRNNNTQERKERDRKKDDGKDDKKSNKRKTSKKSKSSRAGGGLCEGDDDCEEWCEDLFGGRKDRDECMELSVNEVEGMYDAFEEKKGILAEPDEDDLDEVYGEDIENALDIDDGIWEELVDDYNTKEAGYVLEWIAEEEDISDAIDSSLDDDEEEDLFDNLFEQYASTVIRAMLKEFDRDNEDSLFIPTAQGNDNLIEIAHKLLAESCVGDSSTQSLYRGDRVDNEFQKTACTLGEVYCKQDDGDYLFEDVFEDIVNADDALEEYISEELPESGEDIDEDEIDEVCPEFCDEFQTGNNNRPVQCRT